MTSHRRHASRALLLGLDDTTAFSALSVPKAGRVAIMVDDKAVGAVPVTGDSGFSDIVVVLPNDEAAMLADGLGIS